MTSSLHLSVLPGGDEADLQLDLSLMLLVDLKQKLTEFVWFVRRVEKGAALGAALTSKMCR